MKTYVLGAGIHGMVLGYLLGAIVIGRKSETQDGNRFPLGPRILHHNENTQILVEKLGIMDSPKTFSIGRFDGNLYDGKFISDNIKWAEEYSIKTRNKVLKHVSSSGTKYVKGWDWNEIGLLDFLDYNVERCNHNATNVNTSENIIKLSDGKELKYKDLYSTIKLPYLMKLIKNDKNLCTRSLPVTFIHCASKELLELKGDYDYIYFSNKYIPFSRITYLKDSTMVLEMPNRYTILDLMATLPDIDILNELLVPDCQILPSRFLNKTNTIEMEGIKLVGRYAKWNYKLLLNDTIEEGMKYAKDMRT